MKKIQILIICSLGYFYSFAQQTPINDIVTIKFPRKTEKLTNLELLAFVKNKAAYKQLQNRFAPYDFYKFNSMILELIGFKVTQEKNFLEERQKGLYGLAHTDGLEPTNYTSEIKNTNNFRVLITHWETMYYANYSFTIINNLNTSQINGTLNYDKTQQKNRGKALDFLNKLLRTMVFK